MEKIIYYRNPGHCLSVFRMSNTPLNKRLEELAQDKTQSGEQARDLLSSLENLPDYYLRPIFLLPHSARDIASRLLSRAENETNPFRS